MVPLAFPTFSPAEDDRSLMMAQFVRRNSVLRQMMSPSDTLGIAVLFPLSGWATITPSGNVNPLYPAGTPDPWNVGAGLQVGFSADGALAVTGNSQITSAGGTIGFNPGVVGTVSLSGNTSWTNTQDLTVGVFGTGNLNVLQGAQVQNVGASLGHIDGTAHVLVGVPVRLGQVAVNSWSAMATRLH